MSCIPCPPQSDIYRCDGCYDPLLNMNNLLIKINYPTTNFEEYLDICSINYSNQRDKLCFKCEPKCSICHCMINSNSKSIQTKNSICLDCFIKKFS